jgi:hypothetical protein
MSRFQGFHRKVNRRIQNLEHSLGVGSVADAMRVLALTGEDLQPKLTPLCIEN